MLIDTHTHVWPDRIAQLALAGNRLPGLEARGDGTVGGLSQDMVHSGVDLSCCLGVANEARQVESVNKFVAATTGPGRIGFGSVHVDLSVEENLASLQRNGITGIKVHPLFQGFSLEDPRLWEMFEAFGSEMVVIAHVGAGGSSEVNGLSSPTMVAKIARQFPDLRFIACHFGGYKMLDAAEECLTGVDVVLETSWPPSLGVVRPEQVRRIIQNHGAERIVFGSDWPMTNPRDEIRVIDSLGLPGADVEAILGGNMARILRLEGAN